MRHLALALALASCLAAACRPGPGSRKERAVATPTVEDAFRIQFEFMMKKDVDGLWAIYSDAMRKRMEDMARNVRKLTPAAFQRQFGFPRSTIEKKSTREVLQALAQSPALKQDGPEVPKISRKSAQGPATMVYFLQRGRKCGQRFLQVGAHWKVDAPIDCRSLEPPTSKDDGHGHGDGHDHGGGPPIPGLPPGPLPSMAP